MTREELLNSNFTEDQLAEIQAGIEDGVDVSLYAREELLAIQMRQIRLGLLSGVQVSRYNDASLDWFQMEEIRIGLENHIDVDKYAKASIPYMKMRQIRKGLMVGIDLTSQLDRKPEILRQIRKAAVARVDISKYVKEGYNASQLAEIRKGLEKGLNIGEYLVIEFRGSSIEEICRGLESGVDVSIYADEDYSWRQMREIRIGLESQLDVGKYINPFFEWRQMRQIRLGLSLGLDVSSYARLSFTHREMEARRKHLESQAFNLGDEGAEGIAVGDISIVIKDYGMTAVMTCPEGCRYTKDAIDAAMAESNVVAGIDKGAINRVINTASKGQEIVIATGTPPVAGEDGRYEFFFDTNPSREPKELDDGYLDFVNVDWYETVEKDQRLAVYHPATKAQSIYQRLLLWMRLITQQEQLILKEMFMLRRMWA